MSTITATNPIQQQADALLEQISKLEASLADHIGECDHPDFALLETLSQAVDTLATSVLKDIEEEKEFRTTIQICNDTVHHILIQHELAAHSIPSFAGDLLSNIGQLFSSISSWFTTTSPASTSSSSLERKQ
jgi:hypothetical protein